MNLEPTTTSREDAPWIGWLGRFSADEAPRFGNKAAVLSSLSADFTVPAGFVVAAAKDAATGLSRALEDQIARAYRRLGDMVGVQDPPVAVRSSGSAEDGENASHAGLFETYLGVVGSQAVVEAVARCRAQEAAERVRSYRKQLGLADDGCGIGVLVQLLIEPDVSFVAFSVDPVSGEKVVVIEATWGLGEPLVGGRVSPDVFRVDRSSLEVIDTQIGRKEIMAVPAYPGTREVGVPHALRLRPAADRDAVRRVASLAQSLEQRFARPVDLECVMRNDVLYLVQCRPITRGGAMANRP